MKCAGGQQASKPASQSRISSPNRLARQQHSGLRLIERTHLVDGACRGRRGVFQTLRHVLGAALQLLKTNKNAKKKQHPEIYIYIWTDVPGVGRGGRKGVRFCFILERLRGRALVFCSLRGRLGTNRALDFFREYEREMRPSKKLCGGVGIKARERTTSERQTLHNLDLMPGNILGRSMRRRINV